MASRTAMSSETTTFQNGAENFRIQFEVVAPPPPPPRDPNMPRGMSNAGKFQVASIRITDITEGVGDDGRKKNVTFGRGYDTLAQARTGATEYAKRIIREQMAPKAAPPA